MADMESMLILCGIVDAVGFQIRGDIMLGYEAIPTWACWSAP